MYRDLEWTAWTAFSFGREIIIFKKQKKSKLHFNELSFYYITYFFYISYHGRESLVPPAMSCLVKGQENTPHWLHNWITPMLEAVRCDCELEDPKSNKDWQVRKEHKICAAVSVHSCSSLKVSDISANIWMLMFYSKTAIHVTTLLLEVVLNMFTTWWAFYKRYRHQLKTTTVVIWLSNFGVGI